jgi:hypothetical protein
VDVASTSSAPVAPPQEQEFSPMFKKVRFNLDYIYAYNYDYANYDYAHAYDYNYL